MLREQDIISQYDFEVAQNQLKTLQAQLAQAQSQLVNAKENLSYCTVKSPVAGVVGMIPYRLGSLVSGQSVQPLTTVSNISEMYAYFSMPEKELLKITKEGGVDKAIGEIIGLTREQFAQVSMISQGDFRELLQADTKKRQQIFRDIFGTGYYVTLQNRLKEEANELWKQISRASESRQQYISGIVCSEDSLLFLDVKKAKEGGMLTADVMELLDKLLTEATGIMCTLADDAESCVAYGCGKSLAWINHMQEGPINIARKRAMRG